MPINKTIFGYQNFLNSCWTAITGFLDEDYLSDWLQANWELLVESRICKTPEEFLEVYGEGADCNTSSSRVWYPQGIPSHRIFCKAKDGDFVLDMLTERSINPTELTFGEFSGWNGEVFGQFLPFDFILLENKSPQYLLRVNDVDFFLGKLHEK